MGPCGCQAARRRSMHGCPKTVREREERGYLSPKQDSPLVTLTPKGASTQGWRTCPFCLLTSPPLPDTLPLRRAYEHQILSPSLTIVYWLLPDLPAGSMQFRIAYRGRADTHSRRFWHTTSTWEPHSQAYAATNTHQLPGCGDGASRCDDALHAGEPPEYRVHR